MMEVEFFYIVVGIILTVLMGFYVYSLFKFLITMICRILRFFIVFPKYLYVVFFYVFISYGDLDLFEWEESFFFSRPIGDDLEDEALHEGWVTHEEDKLMIEGWTDFFIDSPEESGQYESSYDVGFGRYFYSFCNPFSNFVLKHLTYEFYYYFLEYFFVSIFRIIFLCLFYFTFFIFRGIFHFLLRTDILYFLIFFWFFIFFMFRDLQIFYFISKLLFQMRRSYVFWKQFLFSVPFIQLLLNDEDEQEMFWNFKFAGRDDFYTHILGLDEEDFIEAYREGNFSYLDPHEDNLFDAFRFSPYLDLEMLWAVRRFYRINHWLFWTPVDLLDKRYYVPLISDFSNFSNVFVSDLFVKSDSIFYKTSFLKAKEAVFRKNNLFFYEKDSYDCLDVNFIIIRFFQIGDLLIFIRIKFIIEKIFLISQKWCLLRFIKTIILLCSRNFIWRMSFF